MCPYSLKQSENYRIRTDNKETVPLTWGFIVSATLHRVSNCIHSPPWAMTVSGRHRRLTKALSAPLHRLPAISVHYGMILNVFLQKLFRIKFLFIWVRQLLDSTSNTQPTMWYGNHPGRYFASNVDSHCRLNVYAQYAHNML